MNRYEYFEEQTPIDPMYYRWNGVVLEAMYFDGTWFESAHKDPGDLFESADYAPCSLKDTEKGVE